MLWNKNKKLSIQNDETYRPPKGRPRGGSITENGPVIDPSMVRRGPDASVSQ